jgi:hypothetical protein
MTDETEEEFLLPSPNPAQLPQSPLSPAFVNLDAKGLPWVEIGMDIMFKYLSVNVRTCARRFVLAANLGARAA